MAGNLRTNPIAAHVTKQKNPLLLQQENNKFIFNNGEHKKNVLG